MGCTPIDRPHEAELSYRALGGRKVRIEMEDSGLARWFDMLILNGLNWCREGESNPQDPKVGGF